MEKLGPPRALSLLPSCLSRVSLAWAYLYTAFDPLCRTLGLPYPYREQDERGYHGEVNLGPGGV